MKAEYHLFSGYAKQLTDTNFLSEGDYERCIRSIQSKGIGFVRDLDELCGDLRLGLSRGFFELSEHTHKVFTLASKTVLPEFLLGSLSRIFERTGVIRDDYCQETASTLISFLSCLKRITPEGDLSDLSTKVWSTLRNNFSNGSATTQAFYDALRSDEDFSYIMAHAKLRFREYMDCPIEAELYFGPGKNLDRFEAPGKMNWRIDESLDPFPNDPILTALFKSVRQQANYAPFQSYVSPYRRGGKRRAYGIRNKDKRTLKRYDQVMKCSAQPKSYKALRGVGVMSAIRMALQLSLQKSFYRHKLTPNIPLNDAAEMERNLVNNFEQVGTIDLSTASDRLYWSILRHFGHDVPFFEAAYRLRTVLLVLPDGPLHCASPVMGEAITFPIMSAFFAAVSLAVCDYYGWGHDMVKVYGDDIQTPHYYETIRILELCGCKVSIEKSYPPESRFKESCEAHYCGSFSSDLRYCRPAYIPSGDLNPRDRIEHGYAHILLTIAHDAYRVCSNLSTAICDFVESHTGLELPRVFGGTYHLGRPSSITEDYRALYVKHEVSPAGVPFSMQGRIRQYLHSCRPVAFDPKVLRKQERRQMASSVKRIEMRDTLGTLEAHVLLLCLRRRPDKCLYEQVKSWPQDRLRNFCITHVTADEFASVVDEIIGMIAEV